VDLAYADKLIESTPIVLLQRFCGPVDTQKFIPLIEARTSYWAFLFALFEF